MGQVATMDGPALEAARPPVTTLLPGPVTGPGHQAASTVRPPPRPPAPSSATFMARTSLLAASLADDTSVLATDEPAAETETTTGTGAAMGRVGAAAGPPAGDGGSGGAQGRAAAPPATLLRGSLLDLQRLAGNGAVAAALGRRSVAARSAGIVAPRQAPAVDPESPTPNVPVVQRDGDDDVERWAAVQGQGMSALLQTVAGIRATDPVLFVSEDAARQAGGSRLVVAIHAVRQKGSWEAFAEANSAELAALPTDQIGAVLQYIGDPKGARLYDASNFEGRYDGFVDPVGKVITLIVRIKATPVTAGDMPGADPTKIGTPPSAEELAQFKESFKLQAEAAWSGKGLVRPDCPGVGPFSTRAVVHFVEGGDAHTTILVYGASFGFPRIERHEEVTAEGKTVEVREGRMPGGEQTTHGTEQYAEQPLNEKGYPIPLKSQQVAAAHEFGHAIGLDHPRCTGIGVCYGKTKEEFGSIMGGGMELKRLTIGGTVHNDFEPYEKIGKRWGEDMVFKGALDAKCNTWTGGG